MFLKHGNGFSYTGVLDIGRAYDGINSIFNVKERVDKRG